MLSLLQRTSFYTKKKNLALGFTLVELLVAIAIFAVLSALGWKVFDYMIKVKDRNAEHELQLGQLQEAYQQILRDTVQAVPVNANINHELQPALVLQNGRFNFSKTGVTDPLQQGMSPDERVEYQYRADEKKLYRLKYRHLNGNGRDQPESSVLLNDVEQFDTVALNPNETATWPDGQVDLNDDTQTQLLPKGIKMKLTVKGVAYEWIFSLLNTDYLRQQNTNQNSNSNNNLNNPTS
ncbi:type II secretion system minor pseudopilin GspJ [Acinetobacter bouvetii]|nr:type II secretion system minor pseudopilin GspJ [Acinetobacter bouvetii]